MNTPNDQWKKFNITYIYYVYKKKKKKKKMETQRFTSEKQRKTLCVHVYEY
jgi:hypothetical protein